MYKVGLTGGIGSGKSTVLKWLIEKGVYYIDADVISRKVVEPGSELLKQIAREFGEDKIQADGSLDRVALGKLIFHSNTEREKLDRMMHVAIWERIDRQVSFMEMQGVRAMVFDVPLLYETNWHAHMNEVWVVDAPFRTRIERIVARDTVSPKEAIARMNSQIPMEEKIELADEVIHNDGSLEALRENLEALWQRKGYLFRKA